jgi:hypothetical protein
MNTPSEMHPMIRQRLHVRTLEGAVLALALILAAFTPPTTTWAGEVDRFRVKGPLAHADFSTTAGCIATDVMVEALDNIVHEPPGPPNSKSEVRVNISQFDFCDQDFILGAFGFAPLSDSAFHVRKDLESAQLTTTVEVSDSVSGSSFPVSINITWTAIGEPRRDDSRFQTRFPGFFFNEQLRGISREAVAAGTVSDGTINFIRAPSFSLADIRDVTDGFIRVMKFP